MASVRDNPGNVTDAARWGHPALARSGRLDRAGLSINIAPECSGASMVRMRS